MEYNSIAVASFETKPSKIYERTFAQFGIRIRNMDGVIGYSYTGLGYGEVVVIYWVGHRGEYRNNRLMGGLVVGW